MDEQIVQVGERIRASLAPEMTQRALARHVDMTPDALSRALNGQRGFSILELTRIAEYLQVDLTWLITGWPDPHRFTLAARHQWNAERRERFNPSQGEDQATLKRIAETYRAAYPEGPPASEPLPRTARSVLKMLGPGFVQEFAEEVEEHLGVDVVRVPGLGTDYSLTVGQRGIIVLNAIPHWFRSNWSLAHELAHLARGHHMSGGDPTTAQEHEADQFAAHLLLPQAIVQAKDWSEMEEPELTSFLWEAGVSTLALRTRLAFLRIPVSEAIASALNEPTPSVLRKHAAKIGGRNAITERQQQSAGRRLPIGVLASLTDRVEAGEEDPELLAWALDVDVDDIDFPDPMDATRSGPVAELEQRPSLSRLREYFAST